MLQEWRERERKEEVCVYEKEKNKVGVREREKESVCVRERKRTFCVWNKSSLRPSREWPESVLRREEMARKKLTPNHG